MSFLKIIPLSEAGTALKELRKKTKGFTLDEMATKTGYNKVTLSKVENNGTTINREHIEAYANTLGLGEPYIIFAMNEEDVKRLINAK